MAEITSAQAIREKLREFDEKMDGAISAARAVSRVGADSEQILKNAHSALADVKDISRQSRDMLRALQSMGEESEGFRTRILASMQLAEELSTKVNAMLERGVQSMSETLLEAELRLEAQVQANLEKQAEVLTALDENTRTNAESARNSRNVVSDKVLQLEKLLENTRNDLHGEIRVKLLGAEETLETQTTRIENDLQQGQSTFQTAITEELGRLKKATEESIAKIRSDLLQNQAELENALRRQMTDFLNQQNALVQNLNQHTQTLQNAVEGLRLELGSTRENVQQLANSFTAQNVANDVELGQLREQVAYLGAGAEQHAVEQQTLNAQVQTLQEEFNKLASQLKARSWVTGVK